MNIISCLWIQEELDQFSNICLLSWLRLGYQIDIYTYSYIENFELQNIITKNKNINVLDANIILKKTEDDFLPLSDLFRFTLLSKIPHCIWLDTDMFLLKRLTEGNFVSSEHSRQTGNLATKNRTKTSNIGCISQMEQIIDWDKIIVKCKKNNKKHNLNNNNFMKIYQKEMHEYHWNLIAEPNAFCPVSWAYAKEIYTEPDIIGTKFGIAQKPLKYILENSTGIHLWRNLYNKKKTEITENSVYNQIKNLVVLKYKICIPSYKRLDMIKEKTLKFLKNNNIEQKDINIFVSNQTDFDEYTEADIGNIVLVPAIYNGIGSVRGYIVNFWASSGDNIIMIDDDIEKIIDMHSGIVYLPDLINRMFDQLKEESLYFGGLPLCANPYFLKDKFTTHLKYISGAIQFIRIDKSRLPIFTPYRHFEDYTYCIEYYKRDGGILQNLAAAPITKNYHPDGGICTQYGSLELRLKDAERVADEIIDRFGNKIVSKYYKKKSSRGPACVNLRLNFRAKAEDFI